MASATPEPSQVIEKEGQSKQEILVVGLEEEGKRKPTKTKPQGGGIRTPVSNQKNEDQSNERYERMSEVSLQMSTKTCLQEQLDQLKLLTRLVVGEFIQMK